MSTTDAGQTPAGTVSNPFPNGLLAPPGSKLGLQTLLGQAPNFADPSGRIGYVEAEEGGTSLASPLFAGVMADADQAAGAPLGFINPLLYSMSGTWALHDIIGTPIPLDAMWNPDAVMRVDIASAEVDSQARFDKAAATQLVFEDALFHIVGHLMRTTGSRRLVLTGGTALNAIANMRLLDHHPGLHIWVPPVPSDAGVPVGAAYHFALSNGAPLGKKLGHAFYCGVAPGNRAIEAALRNIDEIAVVNATVLGTDFLPAPFHESVPNPHTRTNIGSRFDYQVTTNNTLTARYQFYRDTQQNAGVGVLVLPEAGYDNNSTEHTVQISDTQILVTKVVNETHFQYLRENSNQNPLSTATAVDVFGEFTGGGGGQPHQDPRLWPEPGAVPGPGHWRE